MLFNPCCLMLRFKITGHVQCSEHPDLDFLDFLDFQPSFVIFIGGTHQF